MSDTYKSEKKRFVIFDLHIKAKKRQKEHREKL